MLKIEESLPDLDGFHRGPDFESEVGLGGDDAVWQVEIGGDGGGRLIAAAQPGEGEQGAVASGSGSDDDARRGGNGVWNDGAVRDGAGGIEGPTVSDLLRARMSGE